LSTSLRFQQCRGKTQRDFRHPKKRACVSPVIGELVTARVSKHVRMHREQNLRNHRKA